jgi:hypothetical protein
MRIYERKKRIMLESSCEKCKRIFSYIIIEGHPEKRFCSRSCANSRIRTQEIKDRVSKKMLGHISSRRMERVYKKCYMCPNKFLARPTDKKRMCSKKCANLFMSVHRKKLIRDGIIVNKWGGRCRKLKYVSERFGEINIDGSWELAFCEWADKNSLDCRKNRKGFQYIKEDGSVSTYFPDFEPIKNIFVEIKGYETELDKIKWSQFSGILIIVRKNDIKNLDKFGKEKLGI